MNKVRISGVGCCLVDRIYDHVDFLSEAFREVASRKSGDGGLEPGKLTFEEELEGFAGRSFMSEMLPRLTEGREPQKENIGGPCIVALINASRLAYKESEVSFYGCRGDDKVSNDLAQDAWIFRRPLLSFARKVLVLWSLPMVLRMSAYGQRVRFSASLKSECLYRKLWERL